MRLITAHRVLIVAGIAFFLFYALFQARLFITRGDGGAVVQAVVAGAVVVGLALYYRSLRGWGRR
jgi:hypothetical protein